MKLSALQRFILQTTASSGGRKVARSIFLRFYQKIKEPPKPEDQINSLTKSLESLIQRGLLVGFGEVTAQKWFIQDIRITPAGKRTAKKLLGQQIKLPFKK